MLSSRRGEELAKMQIFPTSVNLVVVHEGYTFQFDYFYKFSFLTSNNFI